MVLLDAHALDTNLLFMHRGVLEPKSGIGAHFHNQCEEMFVILNGEAQFTIDGRTSLLKGPAGAPCRMGHSHAIYNASDQPVEWMNINVSALKGKYDAFNLGDGRVGAPLDPIPVFMTMLLSHDLLQPVKGMNGGKGAVRYRRALDPTIFAERLGLCGSRLVAAGRLHRSASTYGSRRDLLRHEWSGHREDIQPGEAGRNGCHSQREMLFRYN